MPEPLNISINASEPLWYDYGYLDQLTTQLAAYSHSIKALGGYWQAQFTIRGNRLLVEDWLDAGLGRHIETYGDGLNKIWEGFVNKIVVNYGPLSVTRGPLLDIGNRVNLVYSGIDVTTDPPAVGVKVETGEANDTDSQDLYGIVPRILTTGGATDTDADAIRDTYLAEHKLPKTSKAWQNDTAGDLSATVEALGYVHWLNWAYNSTTNGEQNASVKVSNVLGDTPNSAWLTYGTDNVDTNTLQVKAFEDDDNLAWNVIKSVVARGDSSQNRWLFGIHNDQAATYEAAPTDLEYQQRLSDPKVRVETVSGAEVYPWNVLPGKWLMFPDFLIGKTQPSALREDARALFIEEVRYRAPWGLSLHGGDVDTLPQLLAQFGLGGVGA